MLTSELPRQEFDMVWYHPPYWDIIQYSDDTRDLSTCSGFEEFEEKLSKSVQRLIHVVKPGGILAVLIGDKRKHGQYFPLLKTLLMGSDYYELRSIIIKIQHNCQSDRMKYSSRNPFFIPIRHEYCFVYQKAWSSFDSRSEVRGSTE